MADSPWSVLTLPATPLLAETPEAFFRDVGARIAAGSPETLAVLGGFSADRLGFGFVCGYVAALRRLTKSHAGITALAATEAGGAHPRAIETTLSQQGDQVVLNGTKAFVTLGSLCAEVYVLAHVGQDAAGRKGLRLVRMPTSSSGAHMHALPATPFAPEIPHCRLTLTDVRLPTDSVLPGDGWADYVRPFRTIEDTFVMLAALGYMLGVVRRGAASEALLDAVVAALTSTLYVAGLPPSEARTHVLLGAALAQVQGVMRALGAAFPAGLPDEEARFHRDAPLLSVAEKARSARKRKAFFELGLAAAPGSD
ncbi:MAG TPA: acyl-CoA dehydrogenase family protein [Polyangiaceae bacterium]|nr:acyl-CoA dehydrogenase family protein [Polyangiaceae bacterium]